MTYDEWKLASPPEDTEIETCGAGCGAERLPEERMVDGREVAVCALCAEQIDSDEALEAAERQSVGQTIGLALRPNEAARSRLADDLNRMLAAVRR